MKFARIKPHVVQAWMDPFHSSSKLRETCEKHNIRFMAYSTLGTQWSMQGRANPVLSSSKLREFGDPARVALSWALLRNAVVIPRSFSNERIAANARLYDGGVLTVGLDAAALEAIDALDGTLDRAMMSKPCSPTTATRPSGSSGRAPTATSRSAPPHRAQASKSRRTVATRSPRSSRGTKGLRHLQNRRGAAPDVPRARPRDPGPA